MPNVRLSLVHPSPIGDISILSVGTGFGEPRSRPNPGHAPPAHLVELLERAALQHVADGNQHVLGDEKESAELAGFRALSMSRTARISAPGYRVRLR